MVFPPSKNFFYDSSGALIYVKVISSSANETNFPRETWQGSLKAHLFFIAEGAIWTKGCALSVRKRKKGSHHTRQARIFHSSGESAALRYRCAVDLLDIHRHIDRVGMRYITSYAKRVRAGLIKFAYTLR